MSSEEKVSKHHHHHRRGGRVSVEQARKEIKRWKHHVLSLGEDCPYDFVKAFFIPMDDIKHLYENYKDLGPDGVRAYIGITDKNEKGCAPLRLLLVPATEDTDFYDCYPGHQNDEGVNNVGDSSIYDFTMPCPDVCASINPLDNSLDKK